jgi:hypothetical protein
MLAACAALSVASYTERFTETGASAHLLPLWPRLTPPVIADLTWNPVVSTRYWILDESAPWVQVRHGGRELMELQRSKTLFVK